MLVDEYGHRWLVIPCGPVGWIHNARAAGKVTLSRKGKTETLAIREHSPNDAVPVARRYFEAGIDSPEEEYLIEAQKRPVFELSSTAR